MKFFYQHSLILILLFVSATCFAQNITEDLDNWDNTMYTSNKFTYGTDDWRHSAEFQSRFNDNLSTLEQWHIEYAATYLVAKNWEIVPDFRFTRKPTRYEYRPGIGGIYKKIYKESNVQLVHQIKYQYDIKQDVNNSHGLRYAIFYNKVMSDKLVLTALAGGIFEFGKDFNGFLGLRTGLSAAYVFNKAHSANIGYFYGLLNDRLNNYTNIGIISFQLIINISREYKYVPAKYFSL